MGITHLIALIRASIALPVLIALALWQSQAPKPPEASRYALEEHAMKTVTRILVENKLAPGGGTAHSQRLGGRVNGLLPRLVFSTRILTVPVRPKEAEIASICWRENPLPWGGRTEYTPGLNYRTNSQ